MTRLILGSKFDHIFLKNLVFLSNVFLETSDISNDFKSYSFVSWFKGYYIHSKRDMSSIPFPLFLIIPRDGLFSFKFTSFERLYRGYMEELHIDISRWKSEQLNYFKKYLDNFEVGSREYNILLKGISDLEKTYK